jgi:hypothetical protein
MTLEQLEKERPVRTPVNVAAEIMNINPQTLRIGLQRGKFPFGVAIKRKRWVYWINTEAFIKYMKGQTNN